MGECDSQHGRTVALVTNIPRPYRRPLYAMLKTELALHGFRLRVLYSHDPSRHARRGSPSAAIVDRDMESYVGGLSVQIRYDRVLAIPTGLLRALKRLQPVCVLTAGFSADAMISALWCHVAQVPWVLWSGAWPGREGEISRLRVKIRRRLVSEASAFVAYGTAAGEYLHSLGASPEDVFYAFNTVDLDAISSEARIASERRSELTAKYGLAAKNFLYVGTLVESKGLRELVEAALAVVTPEVDWALHFVGAGPLQAELETTVQAAGKGSRFRFHGLRPGSDVAELLGNADGLFLPTKREVWGLVINEAMACGVPVVVSPWAGAARDLIEDGVTGYLVDPTDTAALAAVMSQLLSNDPMHGEVGRRGAESVRAKAPLDKAAKAFADAMVAAIKGYRRA
jgi:glycosyltransferase involved in cell wall biosynthesis